MIVNMSCDTPDQNPTKNPRTSPSPLLSPLRIPEQKKRSKLWALQSPLSIIVSLTLSSSSPSLIFPVILAAMCIINLKLVILNRKFRNVVLGFLFLIWIRSLKWVKFESSLSISCRLNRCIVAILNCLIFWMLTTLTIWYNSKQVIHWNLLQCALFISVNQPKCRFFFKIQNTIKVLSLFLAKWIWKLKWMKNYYYFYF